MPGSKEDTEQAAKEAESAPFKGAILCVLPYVWEQNCQCQSIIINFCFNLQTKHLVIESAVINAAGQSYGCAQDLVQGKVSKQ